ncbi:MAG: thiamine phosphate synthase [Gemmatimonadales bacterium]|nr:thiamine phosphate synthase [Gemmatimonadales bacterium]
MRPLPRLLAYFDERVAAREDVGLRAAAIAAAGPAVALVARWPGGTADQLAELARRTVANARPPEAQVFVTGRVDIAVAVGATGVVRREGDLDLAAMRTVAGGRRLTWLASVHDVAGAQAAAAAGADALVVGTIWPSASHPGRAGAGLDLLRACAALGLPVFAIGGVTAERAEAARAAGAWGVAAIGALFDAADSYRAARELLGAQGET